MIANTIVQEEILAAVYDEFRDLRNVEAAYLPPCLDPDACQILLESVISSRKADLHYQSHPRIACLHNSLATQVTNEV
jgi:hypothetical protein